ncbi:hypothetical protein [Curtobacterium sp. MCBA15_001]|uniref:hypothetical protein n=1 Tax=Curtobacterium sp. MCBA15_001 TaxID=1898731 RepID=UPI0008DD996E|nr:hypothetical protein [Curtobacterium sp. MCBA15_001]OIH92337.1 hypothetical protein BIU90_10515 [Curtobacterium sp. MCBA15_001]
MSIVKLLITASSAMVVAPVLLFVAAAVALIASTSRGVDIALPGLVRVVSGAGSELASVSLDGAGIIVWWLGASASLFVVLLVGDHLRGARRLRRRA